MKWLLSVLLFIVVAWIMPGVTIENFWVAILASIVLGIIQFGFSFLYVLFFPITVPITILTFGIILVFFNAVCIMITSNIVGGFVVADFWSAFWFGLVYSIFYSIFIRS